MGLCTCVAVADGVVCVQYVDYAKGKESGFLRFADPEEAQKLRAAAAKEPEGGLTIAKHLVTFEALEGELSTLKPNPICGKLVYFYAINDFNVVTLPNAYRRGRGRILEEGKRRSRSEEARRRWEVEVRFLPLLFLGSLNQMATM